MSRFSLFYRLLVSHILVGAVALGVMFALSIGVLREAVTDRAFRQLESARAFKASQIQAAIQERTERLERLAESVMLVTENFRDSTHEDAERIRTLLRQYGESVGSYAVGITIPVGFPKVYFEYKNPYLSSTLGNTIPPYEFCLSYTASDSSILCDILRLHPAGDTNTIVWPFQVRFSNGFHLVSLESPDILNQIMESRAGLGLSGEAYLVGPDSLLRTDSRFYDYPTHLKIKCNTDPVSLALAGKTGDIVATDYRNVRVLSAYCPIQVGAQRWALLAEIDEAEVMQPLDDFVKLGAVGLTAVLLLVLGLSFLVSRPLTISIRGLAGQIQRLARGQAPAPPTHIRHDELGDIQQSINALVENTQATAAFAKRIGEGDFSAGFSTRSAEDELGASLLEMRDKLARYTELLGEKNAQLRTLSEQQLQNQIEQDKVRTLSLIEGQESERRRISQELHDGVGQMLTAIKIHLGMAADTPEGLAQAKALVEQTKDEIRAISNNLMPSVLFDFGLHAALKLLTKNTSINTGLPLQLQYAPNPELRFPPEIEVTFYRIAQEAVNNASKYAKATRLSISFFKTDKYLILRVCDNGIGMKSTQQRASKSGLGLGTMKQRATLLGGRLDVATSLARGTRVTVRIPRPVSV